jgi:hypothetical protein
MADAKDYQRSIATVISITKDLEGNLTLMEGARKASHNVLKESLPVFEHVL